MTELTKEWLEQAISKIEIIRDEIPFGLDADEENTLAALKVALAVLTAEPQHKYRVVGVMSETAFYRLENRTARFIALWPRPGILAVRKRPDDGVLVYAEVDD